MTSQIGLLRSRRFLPLFATQILGAFEDNLFKSAFVMLVTYGTAFRSSLGPAELAAIAGGALIAPFFLFSALAGELADRYERSRLLQILKAAELLTVLAAVGALLVGSLSLSLLALFALGSQATFSSPVRYALLPQHLATEELVGGNAARSLQAGNLRHHPSLHGVEDVNRRCSRMRQQKHAVAKGQFAEARCTGNVDHADLA